MLKGTAGPVQMTTLLRQVNNVRLATMREPIVEMPQGVPKESVDCPIARALSNGWIASIGAEAVLAVKDEKERGATDFKLVKQRLQMSGFTHVQVIFLHDGDYLDEALQDILSEEWFDTEKDLAKRKARGEDIGVFKPIGVVFKPTRMMFNFIGAFDEGKFTDLIEGYRA